VRPTDENQAGSRRPNLMSSSRRNSGEINILAMLDGQAGKSRRFSWLPRAAGYGGAGVLACMLLGGIAWLLHDQTGGGFESRVVANPTVVPLEVASETVPNPALRVAPPTQGAAIVDVAAAGVTAPVVAGLPPSPAQPEQTGLRDGQHIISTRPPVAPAVGPTSKPAPSRAPGYTTARPPARSTPAPHPAAAAARHEAPAHPRRAAAPATPKPAPATVDTDVALISAIIQHVNKRGELKDDTACTDKSCARKLPAHP
jgi:hypothetical protein